MKKIAAILLLVVVPLLAIAGESGIRFDTVVKESGKQIASPSIWVPFGQNAVIEIPGKVRVVANAASPDGDISHVTARMYYFSNGAWISDWDTAMDANIALTPSFERDMGDKTHRVVVKPRKAPQPSDGNI